MTLTLLPPVPRELLPLLIGATFRATHSVTLTLTPPPSIDQALMGAQFPATHSVTLTLTPPVAAALTGAQFPATHNVTLTLLPPVPRELLPLLIGATFPATQNVTLTLTPPPTVDQALTGAQFPATHNVTLALTPPPPQPTSNDPNPLAAIATANFPAPQALSVILVPPPSPFSAIAGANFPAPQSLSVVLVPPPSPYSAIASANFPAPQSLSVVLVPGVATEQVTATQTPLFATVPQLQVGGNYSVQIVQVIPRRGANFFDRNDPTGQATVVVAQTAPPVGPSEVCGLTVFTDGLGNPAAVAPPNSGVQVRYDVGTDRVQVIRNDPPWEFVPGFNPPAGGTLNAVPPVPPGTFSPSLAIGCPGANPGSNRFVLRIRIGSAPPFNAATQVCVMRQALQLTNCDAQGN